MFVLNSVDLLMRPGARPPKNLRNKSSSTALLVDVPLHELKRKFHLWNLLAEAIKRSLSGAS